MSVRDTRRLTLLTTGLVAALATAGCGASGGSGGSSGAAGAIAVKATDTTCDVADLRLSAGKQTFSITNSGSEVTEFEILAEGGRIVGELENIAPGVARRLVVDLEAGTYQAACRPGMVGEGVRQDLAVTGAAASSSSSGDARLASAVTAYTRYVQQQVGTLQDQTGQFVAAVRAGDVEQAKALYPVARSSYERVEPVAESFGDLDPQIDARENDVEPGDTWTGFHVLEKLLWTGGDLGTAGPVADELQQDVGRLASRVQDLQLKPLDLANGALGLLDEIATSKVTGEEDRYSHTDLSDFAANLEGSQQAVQQLRPVIAERDADLAEALDDRFAAAQAELDRHRRGDGWAVYTDLTQDQLRALSDSINALAAQVSRVPAVIAQ